MPVVKVLIVLIRLETILTYLEQAKHKRVLAFFLSFLVLISNLDCKLLLISQKLGHIGEYMDYLVVLKNTYCAPLPTQLYFFLSFFK